jgi:hypothetical protein
MPLNSEGLLTGTIDKVRAQRNPAGFSTVPFYDEDHGHAVLLGGEAGRVQFIEDALDIQFAIRPDTGIIASNGEYQFHMARKMGLRHSAVNSLPRRKAQRGQMAYPMMAAGDGGKVTLTGCGGKALRPIFQPYHMWHGSGRSIGPRQGEMS